MLCDAFLDLATLFSAGKRLLMLACADVNMQAKGFVLHAFLSEMISQSALEVMAVSYLVNLHFYFKQLLYFNK